MATEDLLYSTYRHFEEEPLGTIRNETFGLDFGQNSWTTDAEYSAFLTALHVGPGKQLLDVACGSGGPAAFAATTTGCAVVGVDAHAAAIATATQRSLPLRELKFEVADATQPLPFADASFDAVLCVDSMNHFVNRAAVFKEWRRVLKRGGRALFVDPVVPTGAVTNSDIALRSSIGVFVFVPPELTERWAEEAGLSILKREDITQAGAAVAGRWRDARARHREALLAIESETQFESLQTFFDATHRLMSSARLSRFCWTCEAARIRRLSQTSASARQGFFAKVRRALT